MQGLVRNVASNWAHALVAALLAFTVTPLVVGGLKESDGGNQIYGVWTFIVGLTAYFGLLDLGFYQGVVQYFTRYRTQERIEDFNRVVSTAIAALLAGGALGLLLAIGLAWHFPTLIDLGELPVAHARWAFLIAAVAIIARVPLQMYAAVIVGCNSFHVLNATAIAGRLLIAAGVVAALLTGQGFLGVAIATAAGGLAGLALQTWAAYRVEPRLSVDLGSVDRSTLVQLAGYGKWMFGSRLYDMYLANVDLILVPLLFGAEAIAVYGLGVSLMTQAQVAVQGYTFALTPSAIAADARNSRPDVITVLVRSTRIGLVLSGIMVLGAYFLGESFITLWLRDPSFLGEAEYLSAATVLVITALDRVLLQGLAGPQQALIGTRRVRELCMVKLAQGVVAVALAYSLGASLGILAIPWALFASSFVGRLALVRLACRAAELPLRTFGRRAVLPPALSLALTGAICWWPLGGAAPSGWPGFVLVAGAFLAVAGASACALALSPEERASLGRRLGRRARLD